MPPPIRDNLREWLSEEVAARARITEEDLSRDYEPEPDDVVYTLKPVNGRFKVNCPSQIDIFNLQEGNIDRVSNRDSICGGISEMGFSPLGNKSPLQPSENASDEEQESEENHGSRESGEGGEGGEGDDEVRKEEDDDMVSSPWTNPDILFVQSRLITHGPIG
jgi:hypothetical protein